MILHTDGEDVAGRRTGEGRACEHRGVEQVERKTTTEHFRQLPKIATARIGEVADRCDGAVTLT